MDAATSTAWATWMAAGVALLGSAAGVVGAGVAIRARKDTREAQADARRSADAAEASAKSAAALEEIEAGRRHDELTPKMSARFEWTGTNHDLPMIEVESCGPLTYATVDVFLDTPQGSRMVIAGYRQQSTWTLPQMKPGDRATALVTEPDSYGGRVVVRSVCRTAGGETWTVRCPVDVPAGLDGSFA